MGDKKYPSIMDLALKAGKWSVLAGSGAVMIGGATGCEFGTSGDMVVDTYEGDVLDAHEDFPDVMGVTDVFVEPDVNDVQEPLDYGFYELMGVMPEDYIEWDAGKDVISPDVVVPDVVESDPGLMGDFIDDAYLPPTDVVDPEDVTPPEDTGAVKDAVVDVVEDDAFLAGGVPLPE